jgi:flagellar protein FlgJ
MAGIGGINLNIDGGFGLAANGLRPADMTDPRKQFSRLLNEAAANGGARGNTTARDSASADDTAAPHIMPRQTHIDKTDKLYEQCQALETFLVKNILTAMRKNVMKSSLIDTGFAGEIYEDQLWDEYAKAYTEKAGFGLADLAYLELTGQRGRPV